MSPRQSRLLFSSVALLLLGASPALANLNAVIGILSVDCEEALTVEHHDATLLAFKIGTLDEPDVLLDERLVGGPSVGNAVLEEMGFQIPPNWRETQLVNDVVVAFTLLDGYLVVDSDEIGPTSGFLGQASLQVVGAFEGESPMVTPMPHGYVLEFAPIRELTPATNSMCSVAGNPETGRAVITGYNIYRLPADEWADPLLRDFLEHGYLDHVLLSELDFGVIDAGDGAGDRNTIDEVSCRNADGAAHSGDEVIVFRDTSLTPGGGERENAPDPTRPYWYRVQPVLDASLNYFQDGSVSSQRFAASLVDLDGDGVAESVDLLSDGMVEFIDPSGRGLGLAYAGEILSSPSAGYVEPLRGEIDSDGDGLSDDYEQEHGLNPAASNASADSDADGISDLDEAELGSDPSSADSDGSGEDDRRELLYGRNPMNPYDDLVLPPGTKLGDVAPAGGADGGVNVGDVIRLLRLAAGVEAATPLELLAADIAPAALVDDSVTPQRFSREGDGVITIADVVLQLRQAVGLSVVED